MDNINTPKRTEGGSVVINLDSYFPKKPLIIEIGGEKYPAYFSKAAAEAIERAVLEDLPQSHIASMGLAACLGMKKLPDEWENHYLGINAAWDVISKHYKLGTAGDSDASPFLGSGGQLE